MTSAQRIRLYFPAWQKAARAWDWRMVKGRLLADLDAQAEAPWEPDHPLCALFPRLITAARQLALQEHRSATADDLRHACNLLISGRSASSDSLTNAQLNRVVSLFNLLAHPESLAAIAEWDNPDLAARESLVRYVTRLAPEATTRAIASNAFGTKHWEDLELGKIRWLLGKLKEQKARRGQRSTAVPAESAGDPY
jgi:hypothetical protein